MNIISTFVSEHLINALGWTIIHSLWQGAVVALGFALAMFFMRRFSAAARYTAGVIALMIMLAMSMVTFVSLYHWGAPGTLAVTGGDGSQLALTGAVEMDNNVSLMTFFKNYFNQHLPLVVTVWLLGVLVLMLRLAGGFLYNQRIKVHRTRPLPASWQNRLQAFCRQAGIQKPIRLVESALIKIPTTIGHLKPVILFPVGLVTGMPRDQVEALLAHELAHILRKDYLVNILQNFLDILYFYHPGVRWVSAHVRSERENCCDDIAVSLSGDSVNVARALTGIQGFDISTPDPALAAAGSRPGSYSLLARVKRLLRPPAKGSGFSEGLIGASILLVGLLTLVVSANAATALNRDMQKEKSSTQEKAESVESVEREEAEEKARQKELQKKEQEKLLQIEAMLKAEEMEVKKLDEELLKMEKELKQKQKKLQEAGIQGKPDEAEIKKWQDLKKEYAVRKHRLEQYRLKRQEALLRQHEMIMRAKEKEMRKQEALMRAKEEEMRELEKEMRKKEAEMRTKETEELREQEKEMRKQEAKMREMEKEMRKQEAEMRAKEKQMREQEREMRKQEAEMRKLEEELMKTLINELLKDKLIDDAEEFEIRFKEGELYINGKKQSDEVFKKYRKLYEKGSGKKLDEKSSFSIVKKR